MNDELLTRIAELESFVQRYIELGYAAGDLTLDELVSLHDEATRLLPELKR